MCSLPNFYFCTKIQSGNANFYRSQSGDDEGSDGDGGRGVDERKPAVADEFGGADRGEAHHGEDGHGAAQEREEQVGGRKREVLPDVLGGRI